MEWSAVIGSLVTIFTTGGVAYLIVERLFDRKKDNAEAKSAEIHNGNDVADLYNKIDEIVERKTAPIKNELSEVKGKLANIESRWCCYREDCRDRVLYKRTIEKLTDDAAKVSCKN